MNKEILDTLLVVGCLLASIASCYILYYLNRKYCSKLAISRETILLCLKSKLFGLGFFSSVKMKSLDRIVKDYITSC